VRVARAVVNGMLSRGLMLSVEVENEVCDRLNHHQEGSGELQ
jgi:hypothetical protein